MTTPKATAARFPDDYGQTPETLADLLGWDEVAERIAGARNYWLATLARDGRPHLRPVDGVFVEDALCFGGSPETRWVQHLQHQPALSASLPDDDHAVILEGRAELVEDPAAHWRSPRRRPIGEVPAVLQRRRADPVPSVLVLATRPRLRLVADRLPGRATRFDFG